MSDTPRLSRRALLGGSVASLGLAGVGVGSGWAAHAAHPGHTDYAPGWGYTSVIPFYGAHQAGIIAPPPAHTRFMVFDLHPTTHREGIARLLRIITDDSAALAEGRSPLADSEPELAAVPAGLTVTVGFGPELVRRVSPSKLPAWLKPLPPFSIDQLDPRLTGGDVLIIVGADDPMTLSHAARVLDRQTHSLMSLRWFRDGFRRARASEAPGATMRNLFGQVDGTKGPHPGDSGFDRAVWGSAGDMPQWLTGGTGYVLRVIDMDLDTWDEVDRPDREKSVGRTLNTGAPLTGEFEHDVPDFEARDSLGLPVIPDFAHIRRARAMTSREVFHRRGYNYQGAGPDGRMVSGLLFEAFAADPVAQFVPVQKRLAEMDMMNLWTTPVGSAVFALPPGCERGQFIGHTLFA